jgi:orotidine-5'-phosphate decarboxylase
MFMMKDRLIVALDLSELEEINQALRDLSGVVSWVKVGMEMFYRFGPDVVRRIKDYGFKVFLDLKMYDIPNTVEHAAKNLTLLNVDMFNLHASGGQLMMSRTAAAVTKTAAENGINPPILIGVTVLTSFTSEQWRDEIKGGLPLEKQVIQFASLTKNAGLAGVVCSPQEIEAVKDTCGSKFITVVPGIRPIRADVGDQKRFTTPAQGVALGADYLVIGRPIMAANDRRLTAVRILQEMEDGLQ